MALEQIASVSTTYDGDGVLYWESGFEYIERVWTLLYDLRSRGSTAVDWHQLVAEVPYFEPLQRMTFPPLSEITEFRLLDGFDAGEIEIYWDDDRRDFIQAIVWIDSARTPVLRREFMHLEEFLERAWSKILDEARRSEGAAIPDGARHLCNIDIWDDLSETTHEYFVQTVPRIDAQSSLVDYQLWERHLGRWTRLEARTPEANERKAGISLLVKHFLRSPAPIGRGSAGEVLSTQEVEQLLERLRSNAARVSR